MTSDNARQRSTRKNGIRRRMEIPEASMPETAGPLASSPVMRLVPCEIRERLEGAVLQRAGQGRSLEQIAREFDLARFGVSTEMLAEFADRLDEVIRPVASAQIVAGVLGCLPPSFRTQLLKGSRVLLLSSAFTALSESTSARIPAGELVKLAAVLRSAAQAQRRREGGRNPGGKESKEDAALYDQERMAQAVRTLYGLSWPPSGQGSQKSTPATHP